MIKEPVYNYQGSKRKILEPLYEVFPANMKYYIELFQGSGIVWINNPYKDQLRGAYINDINAGLNAVWECLFDTSLTEAMYEAVNSIPCFNDIDKIPYENMQDAPTRAAFFLLKQAAFIFPPKTNVYRPLNDVVKTIIDKLKAFKAKDYHNHFFSTKPYQTAFNGGLEIALKAGIAPENIFVFADPPYYNTYGYDKKSVSKEFLEGLSEILSQHKNIKWCITESDTDEVYSILKLLMQSDKSDGRPQKIYRTSFGKLVSGMTSILPSDRKDNSHSNAAYTNYDPKVPQTQELF